MAVDMFEYDRMDEALDALVEKLTVGLDHGIEMNGRASLALSGGRTCEMVLPRLVKGSIDWAKVKVTVIDERWVTADNSDSNQALIEKHFKNTPAEDAEIIGLKTAHPSPESALSEIEDRLGALSWPLDAVFMGMGEDGHIASLFPGDRSWLVQEGRCVPTRPANAPYERVSFTPAALLDSNNIYLLVYGAKKRELLNAAFKTGQALEYPVRLILHQPQTPVSVFLSADSAM